MTTATELREEIILKINQIHDEVLLDYVNHLLNKQDSGEQYNLSDFEKNLIEESQVDFIAGKTISNDQIISRNEKWLNE